LDQELEKAFRDNADFRNWFLSRTRFAGRATSYVPSRSDHPWGKFPIELPNPETGVSEIVNKEGETDVLVVLESNEKVRIALHIENKLGSGRFTKFQSELYQARAAA
jgi:hypothetical protein